MTKDQAKRIAAVVRRKVKESKLPPVRYPVFLSKSGMSRTTKFWKPHQIIKYTQAPHFLIEVCDDGSCYCQSKGHKQWVYHNLLKNRDHYPFMFSLLQSEVEFHLDPIDPPSIQDLPPTIQKLLVNKPKSK